MREEIRRYLETDRAGTTPTPWFAGRKEEMAIFERQLLATSHEEMLRAAGSSSRGRPEPERASS